MCDCLDQIEKKLSEHHGTPVSLELIKFMLDFERGGTFAALPPLYYSYMQGKKRKKSYVTFLNCPFCGKPCDAAPVKKEPHSVWDSDSSESPPA